MNSLKRLYLVLTKKCNRNCEYCYEVGKERLENNTINVDDIINVIKSYSSIDELVFFGGEPLLRIDDIRKIIPRLPPTVKSLHISTNGDLLTPSLAKELLNLGVNIQYSINDVSNINVVDSKILYHMTVSSDSIFDLISLAKTGLSKTCRVWASLDRYMSDNQLLNDLIDLKDTDYETYVEVLQLFRHVKNVGRECCGANDVGISIDCSDLSKTNICTDMLLNNRKAEGKFSDCLKCDNDICTACLCINEYTINSHKYLCNFYKFIKKEKETIRNEIKKS